MKFDIDCFTPEGLLKTSVTTLAASGLTGQVALANGGTAVDNTSRTANTVFAGPTSGGAGNASFRALVAADIPAALTLVGGSANNMPIGASTPNTGAFTTLSVTGAVDFNGGSLRVPTNTSSLTTTEAYFAWQSTRKLLRLYDGSRERFISEVGFAPYAYQMGYATVEGLVTSAAMVANGGTYLIPIMLVGHMLLESVSVLNKDTTSARTWGWDLYEDRSSASNSVDRVANSSADETFTAAAASVRTITASSTPVYLAPGYYWLAIQNRHASNTFALGADTVGGLTSNHMRFKTTTNPNSSTLDIVTSWTNTSSIFAARLNGRSANSSGAIL